MLTLLTLAALATDPPAEPPAPESEPTPVERVEPVAPDGETLDDFFDRATEDALKTGPRCHTPPQPTV